MTWKMKHDLTVNPFLSCLSRLHQTLVDPVVDEEMAKKRTETTNADVRHLYLPLKGKHGFRRRATVP